MPRLSFASSLVFSSSSSSLLCFNFPTFAASPMDFLSPVLGVASGRLWDCFSKRVVYSRKLPENLDSLRNAMQQLNNVFLDVKERVDREEKLHKKRTHAVDGWIVSVEAMEKEVNDLLAKGDEEIQKKCLGTCYPKNCRASYKMGKMVRAKMEDVASKKTEGLNFTVVAESLLSPAVIERPLDETVGINFFFNHVCMQLQDEKVTRLGLYGMGGVGKTTILNRINNEFPKTMGVELDAVIWVTVSRPANVEKVQRVLFNKLNIPDHKWEGRCEDERKEEIFNVLKTKIFLLLLDDVWEPLDLLEIGIPPLRDGNNSKVVLTTRDLCVCRDMGAKAIEVKCLSWEDAFALFQKYVGEDTIHSHPQIPKQAETAARECDGLPLALTVIGRAMAGARTPEEWEEKIRMLKNYPQKFPGMRKKLLSRLAFSFESLPDETTKSCFLYCSLFPEDHHINCDKLIRLWIGEGFLDEYGGIRKARNGGEKIIASLKHACLLEDCTIINNSPVYMGGKCVKMHDVIRDMALWLACQDGIEKQNNFVVVDNGELVNAQQLEQWKGAQRISLFGAGFEEHVESSSCFGNLQTLMLCYSQRITPLSFPTGFLEKMPNIKVLNFTNLKTLKYLPSGINGLYTLQYLNLTGTGIMEIPAGLKNLERLRCLILDRMLSLGDFPSGIIPCLSSLQLFSFISYNTPTDCAALIEELEGLTCIEEVSISLSSVISLQTLLNSHKLRGCLKFLDIHKCDDHMNILDLISPHPEKLEIRRCRMLEEVAMHLEKEVGVYSMTFPRHHQSMSQLSYLKIWKCENLKKLTCLAHAPILKFLSVMECESVEELIQVEDECGTSEIKSDLEMLSRLTHLYLVGLKKLRSICRWNLAFPSLKVMHVVGCPNVRKLPFDSNITRSPHLQEIKGGQEWWEQLEWEDDTIKPHLTQYFKLDAS